MMNLKKIRQIRCMKLYSVDVLDFTFTFDAVNKTVSGKIPDFKADADKEEIDPQE